MLLRASWIGLVGMASFASTLVVVVVDPAVASKTPIKPNEGAWFSFPVKAFDSKSPQKCMRVRVPLCLCRAFAEPTLVDDINVHVAPHDAAAVTEDVANKASDAAAAGQPAIASIHFETTPPSGPNPGNAVSFVVSGAVTDAKTTSGSIAMVCDSKSCRRKVEGTDASSQPCKIVKIGRRVVVRGGCGQFTFYGICKPFHSASSRA